jgi:uncharacterized membrane protein
MSRRDKRHVPHTDQSSSSAYAGGLSDTASSHAMSPHHTVETTHPSLRPEQYFRWRGGEITRLEAFCDVVFGFALTLLVVSLEVPRNFEELVVVMRGFLPFAACFAQFVLIWRIHYQFSRRYGLQDPYTIFLNLVLLFLVLFYVYPLKFVFSLVFSQLSGGPTGADVTTHQGSMLMRIYAAGFMAVFLLFALMYTHAYKLRAALGLDEIECYLTKISVQQNFIMAAVGAVSFLLAMKNPGWAGWWYFVLGPTLVIHGTITGKRARLLAERTRSA